MPPFVVKFSAKNDIIEAVSVLAMICVFGSGYLSGDNRALGVGFVIAENDTRFEI